MHMSRADVEAQVVAAGKYGSEVTHIVEAPVAVVTRASRGIGRAIAPALVKRGCKVRYVLNADGTWPLG